VHSETETIHLGVKMRRSNDLWPLADSPAQSIPTGQVLADDASAAHLRRLDHQKLHSLKN